MGKYKGNKFIIKKSKNDSLVAIVGTRTLTQQCPLLSKEEKLKKKLTIKKCGFDFSCHPNGRDFYHN
jgi:hypothetical protein